MEYASRYPEHPGALVLLAPAARMDPERSIVTWERLGGPESGAAARRFLEEKSEMAFAEWLRLCFPLLTTVLETSDLMVRAHWRHEVLLDWVHGEGRTLDLRPKLGAISAPTLVLAGEDDAWSPLELVREVVELLPERTRFHSYAGARHSMLTDAPQAYEELQRFLDDVQAGVA
jgi:proline iminopeptidase